MAGERVRVEDEFPGQPNLPPPAADGAIPANHFLNGLSAADLEGVLPHLKACPLVAEQIIAERGDPLTMVHFVDSGVISAVVPLRDGRAVEACMIGNEGVVGVEACWGPAVSSTRLLVQAAGRSHAIDSVLFRHLLRESSSLQASVAAYDWRLRAEIEQSAACNSVHLVEQRLAKWLLRFHDRYDGEVMNLTQEFLANILGTQRTTVNVLARGLARSKAIKYSRGRVTVTDRHALEAACCECYSPATARRDVRSAAAPAPSRIPDCGHSGSLAPELRTVFPRSYKQ